MAEGEKRVARAMAIGLHVMAAVLSKQATCRMTRILRRAVWFCVIYAGQLANVYLAFLSMHFVVWRQYGSLILWFVVCGFSDAVECSRTTVAREYARLWP
jgi:hypothetical protein